MARSAEHNRRARERSRQSIIEAAIDVFAERGVDGATISDITGRAGVAQGLVNYYFGGKDQLVAAVIDLWFDALVGIARVRGTADERLTAVIDSALAMTAVALPLQRVVLAIQQQPSTRRMFAESEARHADAVTAAEDAVREIFRERGAADPAVEEIMLRSLLEGILGKCIVYGDSYPLESARGWVHRLYGLPEPTSPLPLALLPLGEGAGVSAATIPPSAPDAAAPEAAASDATPPAESGSAGEPRPRTAP
ncbi:TetR/AcrR family transcriptional regulator [Microbacterium resistens]|uniref:TetR/AcrR family transcriptional regulator n=1 Tax=Microbacterium resistens TaxID=156977 RepID=UPI00366FE269